MLPFQIRNDATPLALFDAAEDRQTAARCALLLLACPVVTFFPAPWAASNCCWPKPPCCMKVHARA